MRKLEVRARTCPRSGNWTAADGVLAESALVMQRDVITQIPVLPTGTS